MYLVLDKRAPWRYTRGPFVFLDGLKSSLTHSLIRNYWLKVARSESTQNSFVPLPTATHTTTTVLRYPMMRGVIPWPAAQIPQILIDRFL